MNKKGQAIFVWLMVSVIIFIMAAVLAQPLVSEIATARGASGLDCSAAGLSAVTNATCIILDMGVFYFLSILVGTSVAIAAGRRSVAGFATSIMLFVVMVVLITPLKGIITLFRDSSHLNCGNAAITVGSKLACLVVDFWLFWIVITIFTVAGSYIFIRRVVPE